MKILMWASFLYPHVGGYEKNVLELSRRLVARGHQVGIVTCRLDKSPAYDSIDDVKIIRIPCVKLLNGLYPIPLPSLSLLRMMISRRHDVVVTQTRFFVLSLMGAIHSLLHGIPLVHVERGSCHPSTTNPVVDMLSKLYDHTLGSYIMSKANKVVGVSNASCVFAKHLGAKCVNRIPNGVVIPDVSGAPQNTHGTPTILYVGRLIQAKGVQDLVKALDMSGWKNYSLTVVGSGPYRRELEGMVKGRDNVKFCGELTGNDLNKVYLFARAFVNPSYSEGLPTAVMEAASLGIPIIATDVGGTGEVIKDGETGTLVKPGDVGSLAKALYQVIHNPVRAMAMAERCKELVAKEYSWEAITDKYCELLRDCYSHKTCVLTGKQTIL